MGSIPMRGASTVQIRISEASGSLPDKQAIADVREQWISNIAICAVESWWRIERNDFIYF